MKLYNAVIWLHGEMLNQVPKTMLTAAEIHILRQIHAGNNDPVNNIVHVANVNRTDAAERRRLAMIYSPDQWADGEVPQSGVDIVNKHLGVGITLPQEVELTEAGCTAVHVEAETIEFLTPEARASLPVPGEIVEMVDDAELTKAPAEDDNFDPLDAFTPERGAASMTPKPERVLPRGRRTVSEEV